jgi:hypothetical protein
VLLQGIIKEWLWRKECALSRIHPSGTRMKQPYFLPQIYHCPRLARVIFKARAHSNFGTVGPLYSVTAFRGYLLFILFVNILLSLSRFSLYCC